MVILDAADKEVAALAGHADQARQKVAGVGIATTLTRTRSIGDMTQRSTRRTHAYGDHDAAAYACAHDGSARMRNGTAFAIVAFQCMRTGDSAAADTTSQAQRIAQSRQSWNTLPVGAKKLSGVGLRWRHAEAGAAMAPLR